MFSEVYTATTKLSYCYISSSVTRFPFPQSLYKAYFQRTNKIKKLKSHEFELGFNFHLIYNAALYDLSITSNPRSASTGSQHLQRRFLIVHLQLGIEAPARQPEAPSVSVRVNADCSEQRAGTAEAMEGFCGVSARGDFGVCVERGVV